MPKGTTNKCYTVEFKKTRDRNDTQRRIELFGNSSQFEVNDHHRIRAWERIYLAEGPEDLVVERRGRGSKGYPVKLDKQVEEDLIAEV